MGPVSCDTGKKRSCGVASFSRTRGIASMGPVSCDTGKRLNTRKQESFNGAGPLQWGRCLVTPESSAPPPRIFPAWSLFASRGPVSCDTGKGYVSPRDLVGVCVASMGPVSCDTGKIGYHLSPESSEPASMGPVSCDTGKCGAGRLKTPATFGFNGAGVL